MGKKHAIQQQDPILSNNFKYDKRKKERQAQKLKQKQIEQANYQKRKQLKEIQSIVDHQIAIKKQKLLSKTNQNNYHNFQKNTMNKLIIKKDQKSNNQPNIKLKKKNKKIQKKIKAQQQNKLTQQGSFKNILNFNQCSKASYLDLFNSHFLKQISEQKMKRQQIHKASKDVGSQVKKQLRSLFGVSTEDQQSEKKLKQAEKVELQQENPFNLKNQLKNQESIKINDLTFKGSQIFIENIKNLKIPEQIVQIKETKLRTLNQQIIQNNSQMDIQLDQQRKVIYHSIQNYSDCIYTENKDQETIQSFRKQVIEHIIRHINFCKQQNSKNSDIQQPKNQGFTQCKALILTPFVGDSRAIFQLIDETINKFSNGNDYQVENRQKFDQQAQDDDDFLRIGISINSKKKKIKYFNRFQNSDIIVASPVGLITSSISGGNSNQKVDFSFLSSIQILYIDRAHALMMQNWSHLSQICKNMNRIPKYQSLSIGIDKIRNSFLQLKGRLYRQNIVFTQFNFPQLNALKINFFHNWQGSISNLPFFSPLIAQSSQVSQQFYKISPKQPKDDLQFRFQFFKRKFWDQLQNNNDNQKIIIFVNSYFEFVKLKAFFQRANASSQCISQHSNKSKVQSRLAKFNNGAFRILLITQRAYYFDICRVKRYNHLYFYSLPKNKFIYEEMVDNLVGDQQDKKKLTAIYTQFDQMIIERIVGSKKSNQMMTEYCNNVSFVI